MLLKDFYEVKNIEDKCAGKFEALIKVNAKHEVFDGHFPGNPVMPGVCMMQIIKELTETMIKSSVEVVSLTNAKFMALINPIENSELRLELDITEDEAGRVKVKNTTYFGETVALKLSTTYQKSI